MNTEVPSGLVSGKIEFRRMLASSAFRFKYLRLGTWYFSIIMEKTGHYKSSFDVGLGRSHLTGTFGNIYNGFHLINKMQ